MTSKQALDNLLQQGLKVGSTVRVTKKTDPKDFGDMWMMGDMDKYIGKECVVVEIKLDKNKVLLDNRYNFPATSLELVGITNQNTNKALSVDEEFIKQAYAAACTEWKQKIRDQFPDLFPKYFDFGKECKLDRTYGGGPLMIAHGIAPRGDAGQCLLVNSEYELEVRKHSGRQFLYFKPKC